MFKTARVYSPTTHPTHIQHRHTDVILLSSTYRERGAHDAQDGDDCQDDTLDDEGHTLVGVFAAAKTIAAPTAVVYVIGVDWIEVLDVAHVFAQVAVGGGVVVDLKVLWEEDGLVWITTNLKETMGGAFIFRHPLNYANLGS